jgi:hypothetical protein
LRACDREREREPLEAHGVVHFFWEEKLKGGKSRVNEGYLFSKNNE